MSFQHHRTQCAIRSPRDLIGRDAELRDLYEWIDGDSRLMTIVGTGGCGKTALASHFHASVTGRSKPLPSWFCSLSDADTGDEAIFDVARGLGLPVNPATSVAEMSERIGHHLSERGRCLLVLDNLEQLLDVTADVIQPWLDAAAGVRILATSRKRLRMRDERWLDLRPLTDEAALALFVAHAGSADGSFELNDYNRSDIESLVAKLDRLPLGIEMAAPWMQVVSPGEFLARMNQSINLLVMKRRQRPSRHADLRSAVRWSWRLLSDEERCLMRHVVALLTTSFNLATVKVVLSEEQDAATVVTGIRGLCESGLLVAHRQPNDEVVLSCYQTVFAFVREFVEPLPPERFELCARRFVELAWSHSSRLAYNKSSRSWLERHRVDLRRLNATLGSASPGVAALCGLVLHRLAWKLGPIDETDALARSTVVLAETSGTARLRALALGAQADTARLARNYSLAAASADEAGAIAEAQGDSLLVAQVKLSAALVARDAGRYADFTDLAKQSVAAYETSDDAHGLVMALLLASTGPELDAASEDSFRLLSRADTLSRTLGEAQLDGHVASAMATWHINHGELSEATRFLRGAIDAFDVSGDAAERSRVLAMLGVTLFDSGNFADGKPHIEQALAIAAALGTTATGRIGGATTGEATAVGRTAAILSATGNFAGPGVTMGHIGALLIRRGDLARARRAYVEGLTETNQANLSHFAVYFHVVIACIDLVEGQVERAKLGCSAAAAAFESWAVPGAEGANNLLTQLTYICNSDRPPTATEIRALIGDVDMLGSRYPVFRTGMATIRTLLDTLLGALDGDQTAERRPPLVIGPAGAWLRVGDAAPVDLARFGPLRRLLVALADRSGEIVTLDTLFEIGWEGERAMPHAAAGRVYATLSRLRHLGLKPYLRTLSDGWTLFVPDGIQRADHSHSEELTRIPSGHSA